MRPILSNNEADRRFLHTPISIEYIILFIDLDLNLKFNWFDQCDYPVEHVPICKQVNQSKKKRIKKERKNPLLSTSQ